MLFEGSLKVCTAHDALWRQHSLSAWPAAELQLQPDQQSLNNENSSWIKYVHMTNEYVSSLDSEVLLNIKMILRQKYPVIR